MIWRFLFLLFGFFILVVPANALTVKTVPEVPYNWQETSTFDTMLAGDEGQSSKTPLGFAVQIGGKNFTDFMMDANGYIELLGAGETPTGHSTSYGTATSLITDDATSTYLLAAYDNLAGSFGYRKESDHVLFYYNAATVADPAYRINNFEVVLYDTGMIDWNFRYALFSNNDYDLMTGLYLGPAETLFKAVAGNIPESTSFTLASVPEPASIILIGSGMLGLLVIQRIRSW